MRPVDEKNGSLSGRVKAGFLPDKDLKMLCAASSVKPIYQGFSGVLRKIPHHSVKFYIVSNCIVYFYYYYFQFYSCSYSYAICIHINYSFVVTGLYSNLLYLFIVQHVNLISSLFPKFFVMQPVTARIVWESHSYNVLHGTQYNLLYHAHILCTRYVQLLSYSSIMINVCIIIIAVIFEPYFFVGNNMPILLSS